MNIQAMQMYSKIRPVLQRTDVSQKVLLEEVALRVSFSMFVFYFPAGGGLVGVGHGG